MGGWQSAQPDERRTSPVRSARTGDSDAPQPSVPRVLIGGVGDCGKSSWARRFSEIGAGVPLPPRDDVAARLLAELPAALANFCRLVRTRPGIRQPPSDFEQSAVTEWLADAKVTALLQQWMDHYSAFLNFMNEDFLRRGPEKKQQPYDHVMPHSHTSASFELWEHRGQPFSPVTVSPFTPHNLTLFNPQLVLVLIPLSLYVYHDTHQQNMFQFWRQVSHNPGLATRRVALMFTKFDELKRLLPHYEISRWWPKCTATTAQGVARFLIARIQDEALGTPHHACPMIVTRLTSGAAQTTTFRWVRHLVEAGAPPSRLTWAIGPDPWPRVRLIWLALRKNRAEAECHIARLPPDIIRKIAQECMVAIMEQEE